LYQAPRGTADILPEEQAYWRYVEEKAAAICQLYGYQRIDTPVFEDVRLFARSVGAGTDIVEKEMYTFEDRGGSQMTLRPEGTASVCRAYLEHGLYNLSQPVKLFYLCAIFRYERPQAGRYRQHYQFGFEAIGEGDPALDAEVIDMAWQFYLSLGLRHPSLQLNSIGCRACRPHYLEALRSYYAAYSGRLCADCQKRLVRNPLRVLDCKRTTCRDIAMAAPQSADCLCPPCEGHFQQLKGYLRHLDLPFELNHRLVRGLDYYTRTVFEIEPPGERRTQGTLGGGGRYDDLIEEMGGGPTPALGFAAGIERIILNLKKQGVAVPSLPEPGVFVACLGDRAKVEATKVASRLRRAGVGTTEALGDRSLKAQLRQANSLGVTQVVIIGDQEVESGRAVLRDMATGEQREIPLEEVVASLSRETVT
jgi:histidyl-tRNA synthetase